MGLFSRCLQSSAFGNFRDGSFTFCYLVYNLSTPNPNCTDNWLLKEKGHRTWSRRRAEQGDHLEWPPPECASLGSEAKPLLPRRWVRFLGALSSQLRRPGGPAVVSPRGEAFGRKGDTLWGHAHPPVAADRHEFRLWKNDFVSPPAKPRRAWESRFQIWRDANPRRRARRAASGAGAKWPPGAPRPGRARAGPKSPRRGGARASGLWLFAVLGELLVKNKDRERGPSLLTCPFGKGSQTRKAAQPGTRSFSPGWRPVPFPLGTRT